MGQTGLERSGRPGEDLMSEILKIAVGTDEMVRNAVDLKKI